MIKSLLRLYFVVIYYASWILFASVGLVLNLVCIPLLLLPSGVRKRFSTRPIIRWLFEIYMKWFHATRALRISWRRFDRRLPAPAVYIANHPSLLDAPILLSRIRDAVCIFKPKLMRNPVVGPAAILGGYVSGDAGIDTIRAAVERIREGHSILIFPEGTRTDPAVTLGPLHSGFALIAQRARVPVQLLVIRSASDFLRRGHDWWRPPRVLPTSLSVELDRCWEFDPSRNSAQLTDEVNKRLLAVLQSGTADEDQRRLGKEAR